MSLVGKTIGNIRIVERIGAGGMGEVYAGVDETLERRVALKVIRTKNRFDASARARFVREARILSQLDHPHICRIYHFIEGDAQDFLVLELIEGENLGDLIARDRLDPAQKMRIADEIARVLEAAHKKGVVHRDLKPHNVMLNRNGEVKVLDFGLAYSATEASRSHPSLSVEPVPAGGSTPPIARVHPVHSHVPTVASPEPPTEVLTQPGSPRPPDPGTQSSAPTRVSWESVHTRQGAILGTPGYMSPEQADGRPATTASDMYSFGLLVQFLFTRASAYPPGLATPALLDSARKADTIPPQGLDADLAALIARLVSLAPAARPTAAETVMRLRWIAEKPRRRSRRLAVAAAVVLLVLFGLKYTLDLRSARDEAERRRHQAEDLIGFMLGDLREKLEPVGRLEVLSAVGDKALDYFESLPREGFSEDELHRRSTALGQIGEVRMAEGNLPAAVEAFQASRSVAEDLARRDPENEEWQAGLGAAHFWVGYVHWNQGNLESALAAFQRYMEVSAGLASADPENLDWKLELAYAHSNIGSVLSARGEAQGALSEFQASVELYRELLTTDAGNTQWLYELADGLSWLGAAHEEIGDLDGALENYRTDGEIMERLNALDPRNTEWQRMLALSQNKVGNILCSKGHVDEAKGRYRDSLRLFQALVVHDPSNADWRRDLAVVKRVLGAVLRHRTDPEGLALAQASQQTLGELLKQDSTNVDWKRELVAATTEVGEALAARGGWKEALEQGRRGLEIIAPIVRDDPQDVLAARWKSETHLMMGRALEKLQRPQEARDSWAEAITTIEPVALRSNSAWILAPWAASLLELDRIDEARPIVQRLHEQGFRERAFLELCRRKGLLREAGL